MNARRAIVAAAVATIGLWWSPVMKVAASDPTPVPKKPTAVVITNENLAEYAEKGRVSTVGTSRETSKSSSSRPAPNVSWSRDTKAEDGSPETSADVGDKDRMEYWRARYTEQLRLIEAMQDQIEALDREIPGLWREFYARDDPMYRDGVIKPRLDKALEDRQRIEEELNESQAAIGDILEAARRDGARPSWFRGLKKPTPAGAKKSDASSADYSVKTTDLEPVSVVDADDTTDH